jgi:hypothetical protein
MEDIIDLADRFGLRIDGTPNADFGASSVKGLKRSYKRPGFLENRGRAKDYTISETMYRLPKKTTDQAFAVGPGMDR